MSKTIDVRRFGGVARLYGEQALQVLSQSHVVVAGVGGVGSWAVEALARTAIGQITLIDGDEVALSNTNRQAPALQGDYGRLKVEVLRERILKINPHCIVNIVPTFLTPDNCAMVLPQSLWVIDCIDDIKAKKALIACAYQQGASVFVAGASGGKIDPSRIIVEDLSRVRADPLLSKVRTLLRKENGFPAGSANGKSKKFGILAVVSDENVKQPQQDNALAIGEDHPYGIGFGSSMVVTATVGLRLAAEVINKIVTDSRHREAEDIE